MTSTLSPKDKRSTSGSLDSTMGTAVDGIPTPTVSMAVAPSMVPTLPLIPAGCTQVNGQVVCPSLAPSAILSFHETTHTVVTMSSMESTLILGAAIFGFLATTIFCMFANKLSVSYAERRYPIPSRVARDIDPARQEANMTLVKSMTLDERRAYVTKCLKTHIFEESNSTDAAASTVTEHVSRGSSLLRAFSHKSLSMDSLPTCAICLDPFDDGNTVCSSQNPQCPHQFHLECAFEWLLKSQECPCCRRDYLTNKTPDIDDDVEKGTNNNTPVVETGAPLVAATTL